MGLLVLSKKSFDYLDSRTYFICNDGTYIWQDQLAGLFDPRGLKLAVGGLLAAIIVCTFTREHSEQDRPLPCQSYDSSSLS